MVLIIVDIMILLIVLFVIDEELFWIVLLYTMIVLGLSLIGYGLQGLTLT